MIIAFDQSPLGKMKKALPLQELAESLDLATFQKGPDCIFSPSGKVALMFLKNYAGVSDEKLIEQLNGNIQYQLFCNILIPFDSPLTNAKIVSQIRCELASKMSINKLQKCLADHWRPYLSDTDRMTVDASCYESHVRYPTDVKLLWEACVWDL